MASQITSLVIIYSTVHSGTDQRKHQSSASLAFVWGIHRGPVNSAHKWPVTRKMFSFDDIIMLDKPTFFTVRAGEACETCARVRSDAIHASPTSATQLSHTVIDIWKMITVMPY